MPTESLQLGVELTEGKRCRPQPLGIATNFRRGREWGSNGYDVTNSSNLTRSSWEERGGCGVRPGNLDDGLDNT